MLTMLCCSTADLRSHLHAACTATGAAMTANTGTTITATAAQSPALPGDGGLAAALCCPGLPGPAFLRSSFPLECKWGGAERSAARTAATGLPRCRARGGRQDRAASRGRGRDTASTRCACKRPARLRLPGAAARCRPSAGRGPGSARRGVPRRPCTWRPRCAARRPCVQIEQMFEMRAPQHSHTHLPRTHAAQCIRTGIKAVETACEDRLTSTDDARDDLLCNLPTWSTDDMTALCTDCVAAHLASSRRLALFCQVSTWAFAAATSLADSIS